MRTISTHAVIPGAGLISVHFRMTYRQRIVIVGGISIAQGIRIGKIGVTGVFSGRRAIYPVVAKESLPGAGLRDLVDTANNLLAGTNRTQLLLVADQDVGLAVDLLGDLTFKVTAAKRRRGDLHIGLRRRLIRLSRRIVLGTLRRSISRSLRLGSVISGIASSSPCCGIRLVACLTI